MHGINKNWGENINGDPEYPILVTLEEKKNMYRRSHCQ